MKWVKKALKAVETNFYHQYCIGDISKCHMTVGIMG